MQRDGDMTGDSAADQGWRGAFWNVLRALYAETFSDHVLMVGAGLAFYAVFGLLPALAAAAALWGQVGDFASLNQSFQAGKGVLPDQASGLLRQFITDVPEGFGGGIGLLINLGLVVVTSYRAAGGLLTALNIVYDVTETRTRIRRACVGWRSGGGHCAVVRRTGSAGTAVVVASLYGGGVAVAALACSRSRVHAQPERIVQLWT